MIESFALLGDLARQLYEEFRTLYYVLLPIFFAISLAMAWFRFPAGGPDFVETLKRLCVGTILLAGFPEISDAILFVANGIAGKISDMQGFEAVFEMASTKAKSYPLSTSGLLLGINDLLIAVLSFLTYFILYVARYVMVAIYHFTWTFLSLVSPLVLLFHVFTPRMTVNLFLSLVEVASWQIVWSILSAMLSALPFGNLYLADGNYLTVIVMNFVIALCMVGTPFVVKSLYKGGLASMTGSLGPVVAATMVATPAKAISAFNAARGVLSDIGGFGMKWRSDFINKPLPLNSSFGPPTLIPPSHRLPAPKNDASGPSIPMGPPEGHPGHADYFKNQPPTK